MGFKYEDFKKTMHIVEKVEFINSYSFIYSARPGTPAAKLQKINNDIEEVKSLISNHITYTKSTLAKNIIENWKDFLPKFIKVMPTDYKRAMMAKEIAKEKGIPWEEAVMEGAHG